MGIFVISLLQRLVLFWACIYNRIKRVYKRVKPPKIVTLISELSNLVVFNGGMVCMSYVGCGTHGLDGE